VRDGGLKGIVVSTHGTLDVLTRIDETTVHAQAGIACARIARQCVKWGLGPAEFFAGIPGTLGGALAMNAGAFGGETWRHVLSVETIDRGGHAHTRAAGEYRVSYRQVIAPAPEEWFIAASLSFERRPAAHQSEVRALLERRKASQPIASGAAVRCSPTRREITPRASSRSPGSRDFASAMPRCRTNTRISSSITVRRAPRTWSA